MRVEEKMSKVVNEAMKVLKEDKELRRLVKEWISEEKMEGYEEEYYEPSAICFFIKFLKEEANKGEKPSETLRRLFVENKRWGESLDRFSEWLASEINQLFKETEIPFYVIHNIYKTCHFTTTSFIVYLAIRNLERMFKFGGFRR